MQLPLDHNFPEPIDAAEQRGALGTGLRYRMSIPPRRPGLAGPGGVIFFLP